MAYKNGTLKRIRDGKEKVIDGKWTEFENGKKSIDTMLTPNRVLMILKKRLLTFRERCLI